MPFVQMLTIEVNENSKGCEIKFVMRNTYTVARKFGVSEKSVCNWEKNEHLIQTCPG